MSKRLDYLTVQGTLCEQNCNAPLSISQGIPWGQCSVIYICMAECLGHDGCEMNDCSGGCWKYAQVRAKCCFWPCFLVKFIQPHRWHLIWIYCTCNSAPSYKPWSVPSRRSQSDDRLCGREMDEKEWESRPFPVDLLLSWPFHSPLPTNYLYVMVGGFGSQRLRYLLRVTDLVSSLSTGRASWSWNH